MSANGTTRAPFCTVALPADLSAGGCKQRSTEDITCGSHESYTRKFEGCFWMFKTYRSEGVGKNDTTELGAEVRDALAGWPSVMPIKGLVYP